MRRSIFLTVSLFLAHIPLTSHADSFSIVGENINWDSMSQSPLNYLIGIDNPNGSSELLFLWELNLSIVPASPQTTGDITIINAYQPTHDYLLEDRNLGIISTFSGPANSIFQIGDFDNPPLGSPAGVSVPSSGKYLLEMDLQAENNAQGLFNIIVQPSLLSPPDQTLLSYWCTEEDFLADPINLREFDNLPFASPSPIIIGTVMVQNVPEPSSITILSFGIAVLIAQCFRLAKQQVLHFFDGINRPWKISGF